MRFDLGVTDAVMIGSLLIAGGLDRQFMHNRAL